MDAEGSHYRKPAYPSKQAAWREDASFAPWKGFSHMKRSKILANRQKWIEKLLNPKSKKATKVLFETEDECCCLGHGCLALEIPRQYDPSNGKSVFGSEKTNTFAPNDFVELVGLYSFLGKTSNSRPISIGKFSEFSLAGLNDNTPLTPQEIGAYLQSVIEGGPNTPFRPLTEYPQVVVELQDETTCDCGGTCKWCAYEKRKKLFEYMLPNERQVKSAACRVVRKGHEMS